MINTTQKFHAQVYTLQQMKSLIPSLEQHTLALCCGKKVWTESSLQEAVGFSRSWKKKTCSRAHRCYRPMQHGRRSGHMPLHYPPPITEKASAGTHSLFTQPGNQIKTNKKKGNKTKQLECRRAIEDKSSSPGGDIHITAPLYPWREPNTRHTHAHTRAHALMHTCSHTHTHTFMHIHRPTCTHKHTHTNTYTPTHKQIHTHTNKYTHTQWVYIRKVLLVELKEVKGPMAMVTLLSGKIESQYTLRIFILMSKSNSVTHSADDTTSRLVTNRQEYCLFPIDTNHLHVQSTRLISRVISRVISLVCRFTSIQASKWIEVRGRKKVRQAILALDIKYRF